MARNSSSNLALLGALAVAAVGYAILYKFSTSLGLSVSDGATVGLGLLLATAVLFGCMWFFGRSWRRWWMPAVAACFCIAFIPALDAWGAAGMPREIYSLPSITKHWWATGMGQFLGTLGVVLLAWLFAWVLDGGD